MVLVPAGEFIMGSEEQDDEKPQHQVCLDAFYIDKYEITNAHFQRFVPATGQRTEAERAGDSRTWRALEGSGSSIAGLEQHPVIRVSQEDAKAYCTWAGKRLPHGSGVGKSSTGYGRTDLSMGESVRQQAGKFLGEEPWHGACWKL